MKRKYFGIAVLSLSAALFVGCASVQKIKTDEAQPGAQANADSAKAPQAEMKYLVKKGDSLWKISSKSSIYGDPFEWPLLFKANRDQITDPDIIDTNVELGVKKDFAEKEVKNAVQDAKDTPPYRHHSQPRKKLPLKY
jgi:hypothetical protein